MTVTLRINGKDQTVDADPSTPLLWVLRDHLGMTGTKFGCGIAQCGACTVIVEGRRINSCLALAISHDGAEVLTIEGVAQGDRLHPVQAAFLAHDGLQCGFCTPGMMMAAKALLEKNINPTEDQIRWALSGNLCRCTGYQNIVKAVLWAAEKMRAELN